MGHVTLADVRAAIDARDDLRRVGRIVTTDRAVTLEREILDRWRAGRGQAAAIVAGLPACRRT